MADPFYGEEAGDKLTPAQALQEVGARVFIPPITLSGEGIVTCGGGFYWPGIVILIKMARRYTDMPIQVWYRSDCEALRLQDIEGIPNVTIHDALDYPARRLGGWEVKTIALLNCGFKKVCYLDADAYLVNDPKPMFDKLDSQRFIFWEDFDMQKFHVKWRNYGIAGSIYPPIQGGQLFINMETFWQELVIAHYINMHSEHWYKYQYGDQDSWRVALTMTMGNFYSCGKARWNKVAFVCDHDGAHVAVHRCQSKLTYAFYTGAKKRVNVRDNSIPEEATVYGYLKEMDNLTSQETFSQVYHSGIWGKDFSSGAGSTEREAAAYIRDINMFLRIGKFTKVVDLGSGDGYVADRLQADITRVDVFLNPNQKAPVTVLDLYTEREKLPEGEVALLRDVLHHWPNEMVIDWLSWAIKSSKWKYLICTQDHTQTVEDCVLGGYRGLALNKNPLKHFNPVVLFKYPHKTALIWELEYARTSNNGNPSADSPSSTVETRNGSPV